METIGIAIALGCDAFAVGLGVGLTCTSPGSFSVYPFISACFSF
jgi:putative Mn2+ efflux pump MntP